jgi:hypothetical protein
MATNGVGTTGNSTTWKILSNRPVAGLEKCLGRWVHGTGPGPEGVEKPIPFFFQLLDPKVFDLSFRPGDPVYEVLTNDQKRFDLPRSLPPLICVILPKENDNATGCQAITRYAYSEGAFRLLHDLLEEGYRFSLKEFLRLAHALASALDFLHSRGIVHGQWNARSVLCVPVDPDKSPFGASPSYRFDLLNTGVRYREPTAIPPEYLERGYFPQEVFPPSTQLPDYDAFDIETDIYCFSAFLRDLFQRASRFEELTQQAGMVQDYFYREMLRKRQEPTEDGLRQKEQEILDHLYTFKVKTEEMIQGGLRPRGKRSSARQIFAASRELYEKTLEYADRLFEIGFEPLNVFGGELQHYVPFQVKADPGIANSFEETTVSLRGEGLPYELIRVSLGEHDRLMEVIDASPTLIRFKVPAGVEDGVHRILINNRRTNVSLKIVSPLWSEVLPPSLRKPWAGFGNLTMRLLGENLPVNPRFSLRPATLAAEGANAGDGEDASEVAADETEGGDELEVEAVNVRLLTSAEAKAGAARPEGAAGEQGGKPPEAAPAPRGGVKQTYLVEFPYETPPGSYKLLANGIDTSLRLTVGAALPDPEVQENALKPADVLNYKEQRIELRGLNFHPSMHLELAGVHDGRSTAISFELKQNSNRAAVVVLPAGFAPGEYRLRINGRDSEAMLLVREPHWKSCVPESVKFRRGAGSPAAVRIGGELLPEIDPGAGESYQLQTSRGRRLSHGLLEAGVVEEGAAHELRLSPKLPRGRYSVVFGTHATGLGLRVRRQLPQAAWTGAGLFALVLLAAAGASLAYSMRPEITEVVTSRTFNFGSPEVVVAGARLGKVALLERDGRPVEAFELRRLEWEEGGERYAFEPRGVPPGQYRLLPKGLLLDGEPAPRDLTILSPDFRLEPAQIHRLKPATLELSSGNDFPVEKATGPLRLVRFDPPAAQREVAQELALGPHGEVSIPPGTFRPGEEGSYRFFLNGELLGSALCAQGEELKIEVVGPMVGAIEPAAVTPDASGRVEVQLAGSHLPEGTPLGLVPAGGDGAALRPAPGGELAGSKGHQLQPKGAGRFEGQTRPGTYLLAWDLPDGPEAIPDLKLEVLPQPQITAVKPARVSPNVPVRLELVGLNLKAASEVVLKPQADGESTLQISLDASRVTALGDGKSSYRTEALLLKPGRYSISPGNAAVLEVVEDCEKLLEVYRRELADLEGLRNCLGGGHVAAATRRQAADTFFDQGLFEEALELYAGLDDLKSRFRTAFLRRFVEKDESVDFRLGDGDLPEAAYVQAAQALGWIEGEAQPPSDPTGPWELDFVRGLLAADPGSAVESLALSISKKGAAAAVREIAPFTPARTALARAHLDRASFLLSMGQSQETLAHLRQTFLDGSLLQELEQPEKARFQWLYGHLHLWYLADPAGAEGSFREGMAQGGLEYAVLCRLYLEGMGAAGVPPSPLLYPQLPPWHGDFVRLFRYYRQVLESRNFGMLTQSKEFGNLRAAEQRANLDLHKLMASLEQSKSIGDPFAHHAVLLFLRQAQNLSWPGQPGGRNAAEHRERLRGLRLDPQTSRLRDFYILQAEVAPLEPSQVAVMAEQSLEAYQMAIDDLLDSAIGGPFKKRLTALKDRLISP